VDEALPRILEDAELPLSGSFRLLLAQLKLELEQLAARIEQLDVVILQRAKEDEACQRWTAIPGVGPVTATALIAAVDNEAHFEKDETWRPGSAWFRVSAPAAASRSCWASANEATPTYGDSSYRGHAA
jgi:transposase